MTCLVVEAGKVIIDVRGAILHLTPTEALTLYNLLGNAVNPVERVTATLDRGDNNAVRNDPPIRDDCFLYRRDGTRLANIQEYDPWFYNG